MRARSREAAPAAEFAVRLAAFRAMRRMALCAVRMTLLPIVALLAGSALLAPVGLRRRPLRSLRLRSGLEPLERLRGSVEVSATAEEAR